MKKRNVKKRNCYLFVFDGFSDWEPVLLTAGLSQFTDFAVRTFSLQRGPVRAMGNLPVANSLAIDDIDVKKLDLLVLPGGTAWTEGRQAQVYPLVAAAVRRHKCVAAIGAATAFLGQHGFLNTIRHTSNHISYLKQAAPAYQGEDWYVNKPCITEGNIITAGSTAATGFADAVFRYFNLLDGNDPLSTWFLHFQKAVTMPQARTKAGSFLP